MPRFNIGDSVLLLRKYAKLYGESRGVVSEVIQDKLRSIFDEYVILFGDGSTVRILDFQMVEDAHSWPSLPATVVMDTDVQPLARKLRGPAYARQLLLQAEGVDLHLEVFDQDDTTSLLGQVLEKGTNRFPPDVEVRLVQEGIPVEMERANMLGEFRFYSIPAGLVMLEVLIRPQHQRITATVSI